MSALVSIIIPFYNDEQYLHRAIDSAIGQLYTHTEIILVNDGSTDASLSIAEDYLTKYKNLKLISTDNKGPGHARNIGLAHATGQYLTFLDSDDELNKEALSTWIKRIEEEDADIVIGKFSMINVKHETGKMLMGWRGEGNAGSGIDGVKAMYEYRMSCTPWGKLYQSDKAKQIRFPEGVWFEDRLYLLKFFLMANRIVFDRSSQINVLSRQGSITRSLISEKRIKDAYDIYLFELSNVEGHELQQELTRLIDRHQINAIIETMIIMYYDRNDHLDMPAIKKNFSHYSSAFIKRFHKNATRPGLHDRADLLLIQLHRFTGWSLVFFLLPIWKRKKCRSVLTLKSF
jgi:glycosyltransferase involved in cell wall biosynthesis